MAVFKKGDECGGVRGLGPSFHGAVPNNFELKGSKKLLNKLRERFSLVVKHTAPEVEAFNYLGSRCNKRITGLFTQISSNQSVIDLISGVGAKANGDEGTAYHSNTTGNESNLEQRRNGEVAQMAVGRIFRQLFGALPVFYC